MPVASLLPPNGTGFLRALEQATAYEPGLTGGIDLIPDIKGRRLPAFIQFLLYEYGLIELTPYVENPYTLLDEGRIWQIERDTFAAIARGLGWVNAPAAIVEAATRRYWWNNFQLYFQSLPPNDFPTLDRIDRITQLSKPYRSDFRRGVFGYDAPAMETDATRLDSCLLDQESGVRLRDGGPLWSFGRAFEYGHTMTEAEGNSLGNYLIPTGEQSLFVNFLTGESSIGDIDVPLDDAFSFARASGKWAPDSAGAITEFPADTLAVTDIGLLYEPAATNSIIENVDGSIWEIPASRNGLTAEIVGSGIIDGIEYTDFRLHGVTTDRTGTFLSFNAPLAATAGQEHWLSAWAAIVGGSTAGLALAAAPGSIDLGAIGPTLERVSVAYETSGPDAVEPGVQFAYEISETIDITLRLGLPQLERDRVSSVIKTTGAAATRAADIGIVHLPFGIHFVTVRFDDGSEQTFDGLVGDFTLPAASLERPWVVEIEAFRLDGVESLKWFQMTFPWEEADFPWVSEAGNARRIFLANWFNERVGYLVLRRADNSIIGYRRARAIRQVKQVSGGPYNLSGVRYGPNLNGENVIFDAMTDAGDGAGETAAKLGWLFNATRISGIPAGRLWLEPGELTGGAEIAQAEISIPLRATVRDRATLLLRF